MKPKQAIILSLIVLAVSAWSFHARNGVIAEGSFSAESPKHMDGLFYVQWIVETNDTETVPTMEHFEQEPILYTNWVWGLATNYLIGRPLYMITNWNSQWIDTTVNVETKYVHSNLVSFLVWRGRTNINYLESVTVCKLVRKPQWRLDSGEWHVEQ